MMPVEKPTPKMITASSSTVFTTGARLRIMPQNIWPSRLLDSCSMLQTRKENRLVNFSEVGQDMLELNSVPEGWPFEQ